jgi:1-deoxyxylulose-5-phosphate synthase
MPAAPKEHIVDIRRGCRRQSTAITARARLYYHEDNWRRMDRATRLGRSRGCTPSQVALAWLLNQPLDVFAVVGCTQVAHLDDALGAVALRLTPEEIAWLNLERGQP